MKFAPPNIWIVRTSARSEREFSRIERTNPLAAAEFSELYLRFQNEPRALGRRFRHEDPVLEHWVYESPRVLHRPVVRIYYTIRNQIVSIEAISVK